MSDGPGYGHDNLRVRTLLWVMFGRNFREHDLPPRFTTKDLHTSKESEKSAGLGDVS